MRLRALDHPSLLNQVETSFFSNPMAASYFVGRRKLYGRIIGVDVDESRRSIQLTVRHLSPVGQILPKTWFDFFMRFSPLAGRNRSKQKPEETKTELLRVQIGKSSLTLSRGSHNFRSLTSVNVFLHSWYSIASCFWTLVPA